MNNLKTRRRFPLLCNGSLVTSLNRSISFDVAAVVSFTFSRQFLSAAASSNDAAVEAPF